MRHISIVCLAAIALVAATGCGGSDGVPEDAVAVVGEEAVTKDELDRLLRQTRANAKASRRPFPKEGTPQYRQMRNQIVQYLVRRAQLAVAAEERDIDVSDDEVEQRQKLIVTQYFGGSEERYRQRLAKQGVSEEQARADLEASLLQDALYKELGKDVEVTDAEVREHYEKNKRRYASADRREVRQIVLRSDQRGLAQRLADQARSGATFASLARRYSQDPRAKSSGGRLEIPKGTSPAFDRAAFSAPVGKIVGPLRTHFGWHVIQPLGPVQAGKTRPYAEVKEQIRQDLLQEKRSKAVSDYLVEIAREAEIEYRRGYGPRA